jgi:colanic acid biosynthesis protein WcaH
MFIPKGDYEKILDVLPILCVDCVITHNGKCLLLRRKNEPAKGQYWFPGGRVYKNEMIRYASQRKALEEVSLTCRFEKIISIEETMFARQGDMTTDIHSVNVCCHLSALEVDNFKLDDTHDGFAWVNAEEAKMLNLHEGVLAPLLKCLENSQDKE